MYKVAQEKVDAIAKAYCGNGYKKVLALLSVGYSKGYAKTTGLKLYDNARVVDAIKAIQAKTEQESVYSRLTAEQEYEEARVIAKKKHDASAMASATTGKAKLYGYHITTNLNIDANTGRRPLDAKEAIEHSRKRIESISK